MYENKTARQARETFKKEEEQMKKIVLFFLLTITLVVLAQVTTQAAGKAPDKIVFGRAISLSGPMAAAAGFLDIPIAKVWLQEVNKKGGIYVPEYGKRLPVELLQYDDKGDIPTLLKLFEKLATVDKVDIILPPCGTAYHLAVAPLAAKYKYPLVALSVMTEKYRPVAGKYGYMFQTTTPIRETMEAFRDLLVELGVKTAAIIYVSHEFGIENTQYLTPLMAPAGIDVVMRKAYPMVPKDLSPLLKEAKNANVDAFIAHSYIQGTLLLPEQARMIDFNPKLFYTAVGTAWPVFKSKLGAATEGIMGPGGWNQKYSPEAKEFYDKFLAMHGRPPGKWSTAIGYSALQIYEQAIAKAGYKDREKLRDFIATSTFDTVYGPIKFTDYFNVDHPSYIAQYQKGIYESVAPKKNRRVNVIYPKPSWPKK